MRALAALALAASVAVAAPARASVVCEHTDREGDVQLAAAGTDGYDIVGGRVRSDATAVTFGLRLHTIDSPENVEYRVRVRSGGQELVAYVSVTPVGSASGNYPYTASALAREIRIKVPYRDAPPWFRRGARIEVTMETARGFVAHVPADDLVIGRILLGHC